ncbi:uncharacterized protein LOC114019543 isoform X5 [Chelonia mydas]|uniref:uncharacterized protein LOC114019543 isoform X5 n=1 Tax=Chelonia mydas TaxID=8469 RepID=UPI0018A20624|nr:uncharacterized protein LOC114019543 isoform X5 [Chelonia mydas]
MCRSRGDAVIGGGSPPASPGCLPGLCSNIWFWRCTTGILAVVSVLILCIHLEIYNENNKARSVDWTSQDRRRIPLGKWDSIRYKSAFSLKWRGLRIDWRAPRRGGQGSRSRQHILRLAVKGSGECAYIESAVVSSSGCSLPRGWVCKKGS